MTGVAESQGIVVSAAEGANSSAAPGVDGDRTVRKISRRGDRYYGDFRTFDAVGGGFEALMDRRTRKRGRRYAATSLEDAKRYYDQRLNELLSASELDRAAMPCYPNLWNSIEGYLLRRTRVSGIAPSTLLDEATCLNAVAAFYGNVRLDAIDTVEIDEYVLHRAKAPGSRRGSTITSRRVYKELLTLRRVFRWAKKHKLITRSPLKDMPEELRVAHAKKEALSPKQLAALLDAAHARDQEVIACLRAKYPAGVPPRVWRRAYPYAEALIAVLAYTGARLGEARGMCVEDVLFDRKRVRIASNRWRKIKREWHRRSVPMRRGLAATVRKYIAERGLRDGPLFPGARGGIIKNPYALFNDCVRRAGLTDLRTSEDEPLPLTPHILRHTFATFALLTIRRKTKRIWIAYTADDVKRLLGHRHAKLIDRVYGHVTTEMRQRQTWEVESLRSYPSVPVKTAIRQPELVRDAA